MSSLASSPPKAGGEAPLHNWARMQYPESYMRSVEGEPMGQAERDGYSAAEMAQMRRSEMEKARMYAYENRGPGGQYAAMHMHHMPAPYHAAAAPGAYMRHMAADRDYSGEMDEVLLFPALLSPVPESACAPIERTGSGCGCGVPQRLSMQTVWCAFYGWILCGADKVLCWWVLLGVGGVSTVPSMPSIPEASR